MKDIELLDPTKTRKVEVPYFLKDSFIGLGYKALSNNNFIKNSYLFIELKIFRFPRILLQKLLKANIYFSRPKYAENLIFDKADADQIELLFPTKNYKIINNRVEDINEIYLSIKILTFMIINIFARSLRVNYLIALILEINPKKAITFNDHSTDFSIISLSLNKSNIKFIGIQQAGRSKVYLESFKDFRIHLPYYYTIGDFELDIIPSYLKTISIIKPIGSLKIALAKEYFSQRKMKFKKSFDICIISEPRTIQSNDLKGYKNLSEQRALIVQYVLNYCTKFKKKYIFSGKHDINDKRKKIELSVYKHYLKDLSFNLTFNSKKEFGTYQHVLKSDLIIGATSSMLQESFGLNKKVLYCDYQNDKELYPYLTGICVLKDRSYNAFEKRINKILSLNYNDYLEEIDQDINYIYNTKVDTLKFLKNELKN